jgi:polar amino acid transport system permease protein
MATVNPPSETHQETIVRLLSKAKRENQIYQFKTVASWVTLLALLALLFSGFEFNLGFMEVSFIKLDPAFIKQYGSFIAEGALQTILISFASILLATILALAAALGRLSDSPALVSLSTFYISLIRGTPLYLQIIFFFLALPQMGILLSGFWAGVLALGLNYGAYMSEIFRAGIQSVNKGQHEAATALGMSGSQKMRLIVLPQALKFAIPPIGNQFIAMLKDSALVSVTGFVRELLWRAQKVGRANFRNLEALLVAAFFYWMLTLIFSYFQARIEARYSQEDKGRPMSSVLDH